MYVAIVMNKVSHLSTLKDMNLGTCKDKVGTFLDANLNSFRLGADILILDTQLNQIIETAKFPPAIPELVWEMAGGYKHSH